MTRLDTVERAVADIAAGKAVVVVDDEDRENEGDLIFAAEKATPETGGVHGPLHLRLHLRAADRRRSATGSACRRCTRSTRTSTAPPTP